MEEIQHKGMRARRISTTSKFIREDGVVIWKYKSKEGYRETIGSLQKDKYRSTTIDGKQVSMHRLVAIAFLPNPDSLPVVDHIDEDKHNNNLWNLRWCTHKQNSEYCHNLPGRVEKREFMQEQSTIIKKLEDTIRVLRINASSASEELQALRLEVTTIKAMKITEAADFEKYKITEEAKIAVMNTNYVGYKTIHGATFGSIKAMVDSTGKKVIVGGVTYPSAGAAATYIVSQETLNGESRNKATVSKELRRFLQGKRDQWLMYGKYSIGY